jgi:predicted alpha-1,6-mannanase (GH76 family)
MAAVRLAGRSLVIVVAASALGLFPSMTAPAGAAVSPQQAGLATLMKSYGSTYKDLIGGSFWQAAVAQSTLDTYDQATRTASYYQDIARTYRQYRHGPNPVSKMPDFEDNYTDDTAWWGLAWLQAYVMTRDVSYLHVAEADAKFIHREWDTSKNSCGGAGGVWWFRSRSGGDGRVAISNGLFLELTAWLHNVIRGDTTYLRWAKAEWAWLARSGLIDRRNHLVWNGFGAAPRCEVIGPYWSYDMGSVIAGLAQLYKATKKARLLTEAKEIAAATVRHLAPRGVLADPCQPAGCRQAEQSFKGIFIRDLQMLATIARSSAYDSFFRAQRSSVEVHDTSRGGKFGLNWSGPIRKSCATPDASSRTRALANICTPYTQASAEDAMVAAFASQRPSPGKHHPACQDALAAPGTRHRPPACRPTSPSPRPAPGS